jgi:hypothetical protein
MDNTIKQLQAPFKPDEVEWRVGVTSSDKTKGLVLAYVTNRAIQNRLDEVFGVFGWKNEFREWKKDGQLCGISVNHEGEWITKFDGADDSNMEATKGGLSDAMKRAAYQWGIGRYLYELPNVWMPIKKQGSSYVLTDTPKLPAWALPEGYEDKGKATVEAAKEVFADPDYEFDPNDPALQPTGTKADQVRSGCEVCDAELTQAAMNVSKHKFNGKVLCLKCQKEEN